MLHKIPEFDLYYVAYLKDDPAKEPIAASYSSPGVLAEAALTWLSCHGRLPISH
ncbi:MAG TPA: hypothetical protein VN957_04295 [Chthoniobacterales bacterium]|nr:hypothetical protein [Chthoniobacterales bacterium]